MMSPKATLQHKELEDRARRLARGDAKDRAESATLLTTMARLRDQKRTEDESRSAYTEGLLDSLREPERMTASDARYKAAFHRYLYRGEDGLSEAERRDLLAGTQSITYTLGAQGGYTIPLNYESTLFTAMAQVDPLMNDQITNFTMESTPTLQPRTISGYDLSTIEATLVGETVQQTAGTFPTVSGKVLSGTKIFKVSIAASFEAEQDVPGTMSKMATAMGVGFARRLGADAINGNGTTTLQGITTAISPSYVTGSGKLVLADFVSIFSQVDPVYRSSPKCAWLISNSVLERVRLAVDGNNRPLIDIVDDKATILGRPVYVSPTLGALSTSLGLSSTLVFGDLSHYVVRVSRPQLKREINQSEADVTKGEALYVARIRADAAIFDPSNGSSAPIVTATVTV